MPGAWKLVLRCVPSQDGLLDDPPHRLNEDEFICLFNLFARGINHSTLMYGTTGGASNPGSDSGFHEEFAAAAKFLPRAKGLDEAAGLFDGWESVLGAFRGVASGLGNGVDGAGCAEDEAHPSEVTIIEFEHEMVAGLARAPEYFHEMPSSS